MKSTSSQQNDFELIGLFPAPAYSVKRDSDLNTTEEKEIRKIIDKEGMYKSIGNFTSVNIDIFEGKLKGIKQFCEEQLDIYVSEIINPKEELDFYITQSWLNVTEPGDYHHEHFHPNSIISGVFYISTEEDDKIMFTDPNAKIKGLIKFAEKEFNPFNSPTWFLPVNNNELLLFPSWLSHRVDINEKATTDRISLSFNTFVGGNLGLRDDLTELIL